MNFPVYNPQLLNRDEAIAQFIARKALFARVMEGLTVPEPSHTLFIGTRGMGKTTLLQRIRYGVEEDPKLRERFIALQFPEEQYAVLGLDTFYLNALDALGDALEREGLTAEAAELDRAVEEAGRARDVAEAARAALESAAGRLGRKLLFLIDNAERVLDELPDKTQWTLRETLAASPWFVFFGASTQAVVSQFTPAKAFHEFFRIEFLNPLKPDEIEAILVELAKLADASPQITKWIEEDRARLQTLIRLTGGNPRTIVILFGLVLQGPRGDVASELERLLDACTPAYKGRIEDLPPQAQAVLHGVAEYFDPVSAAEVAARIRMETSSVSTNLTRLLRMGLVEKTDAEEPRVRYQVAERFFNIWYLMRQSRRVRSRMRWLVEFLRVFFDRTELLERGRQMAGRLCEFDGADLARHSDLALAYSAAVDGPGRASLELSTLRGMLDKEAGRRQIREIIEFSEEGDSLRTRAERLLALDEAKRVVFSAKMTLPDWSADQFWNELGGSWILSAAEKRDVALRLTSMTIGDLSSLRRTLLQAAFVGQSGSTNSSKSFIDLTRRLLREGLITAPGNSADSKAEVADALRGLPDHWRDEFALSYGEAEWLQAMAYACAELAGDPNAALELIDRAASQFPGHAGLQVAKGIVSGILGLHEVAEHAFRKVLKLDPKDARAWYNLGNSLSNRRKDDEAEHAYRKALKFDSKYAKAWGNLGNSLSGQGKHDEAELAYREALGVDPKVANTWYNLGVCLGDQGKNEAAPQAYGEALNLNPKHANAWYNRGLLLEGVEAISCFIKSATFDPGKHFRWAQLVPNISAIESAARGALVEFPQHSIATTYLAAAVAGRTGWAEAEGLAADALPRLAESELPTVWWALETLSRAAVEAKKTGTLIEILEKAGLDDPWRPWLIALRVAHSRRLADLKLVAPETREPAEAILKLIAPSLFN